MTSRLPTDPAFMQPNLDVVVDFVVAARRLRSNCREVDNANWRSLGDEVTKLLNKLHVANATKAVRVSGPPSEETTGKTQVGRDDAF